MMLTIQQQAVFVERTCELYQSHKRRARVAGQFIDYKLEDLRALVRHNLGDRHCHYCRGPVTVHTFSLDQKIPTARGGSYSFHNLAVSCAECSLAKGIMDYVEYKELIGLICSWTPSVRKNLLERLKEGGARVGLPDFPSVARCGFHPVEEVSSED